MASLPHLVTRTRRKLIQRLWCHCEGHHDHEVEVSKGKMTSHYRVGSAHRVKARVTLQSRSL